MADPRTGTVQTTVTGPAATIIPAQVRVSVQRLNVRKKPKMTSMIVSQLTRGTIVKVTGNVAGWYKVRLSDGTKGWLKIRFTTPVAAADG